jgi:hypothetical protein
MSNSPIWLALTACALTWTGCFAPTRTDSNPVPPAPAPSPELRVADPGSLAAPEGAARRAWLQYESARPLHPVWVTRPPSANLYPRWEQLLDQRRLSDGTGFRLSEGSSLGALWTSEDGPAGIVAFRREF